MERITSNHFVMCIGVFESSFQHETASNTYRCADTDLKRPFDYIIALEDAFLRDELL